MASRDHEPTAGDAAVDTPPREKVINGGVLMLAAMPWAIWGAIFGAMILWLIGEMPVPPPLCSPAMGRATIGWAISVTGEPPTEVGTRALAAQATHVKDRCARWYLNDWARYYRTQARYDAEAQDIRLRLARDGAVLRHAPADDDAPGMNPKSPRPARGASR